MLWNALNKKSNQKNYNFELHGMFEIYKMEMSKIYVSQ